MYMLLLRYMCAHAAYVHVARLMLEVRLLCGGSSQHTPARDANQHNSTAARTPGPLSTLHRAYIYTQH